MSGTTNGTGVNMNYYNQNPQNITAPFDPNKFNQDFEAYLAQDKAKRAVTEQRFLDQKTIVRKEKLLHELTFYELMVNMKNSFFDVLNEVIVGNITKETFTKNNRLFYIGLLLILFAITVQCVRIIFD